MISTQWVRDFQLMIPRNEFTSRASDTVCPNPGGVGDLPQRAVHVMQLETREAVGLRGDFNFAAAARPAAVLGVDAFRVGDLGVEGNSSGTTSNAQRPTSNVQVR